MSDHLPLLVIVTVLSVLVLQQCASETIPQEQSPEKVYHLVEEVRIGELEGEEEYMFSGIGDVAVGDEGKFIVADSQIPVIRMYDSEGTFIRQVGQQGKGPGEYEVIIGMKSFPDGRFAISDPRNLRITTYDPHGEVQESHSVLNNLFSAEVFEIDRGGNFYFMSVYPRSQVSNNWKFFWQKVSPEGEVVDTLDIPSRDDLQMTFVINTPSGSARPFVVKHISAMSPLGYLVSGKNDRYEIEWVDSDGKTVSIERDYTPVAVKPEEKEQWIELGSRFDLENEIPEVKPAFKEIFTDSQGRIWVWRYVEAELTDMNSSDSGDQWWEPPVFDVFMPDGSYHATVILPWRTRFEDAIDDQVWGVYQGDMEEDYAVRYRMEEMSE